MLPASVRTMMIVVLCLAFLAAMAPSAAAQPFDRRTIMTINQPFQVPGTALPAGKYVIRLMDTAGTRTVVQILNAEETKSYAIVLGIPDYKLKTPEKTEFSFYEAKPGNPVPLHAWFYPGNNYGVEFVYPKAKAVEIAKESGEHVIATTIPEPVAAAELKREPLVAIEPGGKEVEVAKVHPEAVTETRPTAAEPKLAAEAPKAAEELPKTASPIPLVALTGLLAAGAASVLRAVRRRS
jgi:hypothetical protein